ncbi:MAG: hypothetical protein LBP75_10250 [Planctomycetota bacterium]|jgi:hypothetical protein|nr:hypothetical protein [Planctomycetota bacterium]
MNIFENVCNSLSASFSKLKKGLRRKKIVILTSQYHELYLPLYYATWIGELSWFHWFRQRVNLLLKRVDIQIRDISEFSHDCGEDLDAAVYEVMMNNGGSENIDGQDIYLTITDPTQIFKAKLTEKHLPAVLATIVTNGGFWAVEPYKKDIPPDTTDDKAVNNVKTNMDTIVENYNYILAYAEGTTSYRVAQVIKEYGKSIKAIEIKKLNEDKKTHKIEFDDTDIQQTIAVSPNILSILGQEASDHLRNVMHLNQTGKFDNVISCALIGRSNVVTEDAFFVGYIVGEIEYAVKKIQELSNTKRGKDELIKFMKYLLDRYYKRMSVAGGTTSEKSTVADEAIIRCINYMCKYQTTQTMNGDVTVDKSRWQSTAQLWFEIKNIKSEPENPKSNANTVITNYFEHCISPYADIKKQGGYRYYMYFFRQFPLSLQLLLSIAGWALLGIILWLVFFKESSTMVFLTIISSIAIVTFPFIVKKTE